MRLYSISPPALNISLAETTAVNFVIFLRQKQTKNFCIFSNKNLISKAYEHILSETSSYSKMKTVS